MVNLELKQGQQVFEGVLVEFSDVSGKSKKDGKEFHFCKFNIDIALLDRDGKPYSKLCEFIADPNVISGQSFEKYRKVYCIFEIISPLNPPKLIKVIKE